MASSHILSFTGVQLGEASDRTAEAVISEDQKHASSLDRQDSALLHRKHVTHHQNFW